MIDEIEIDGDASLNRYVRESLHDSLLIDLMGELPAELRKVVLAVGVLDMREEVSSFAYEVIAAVQEVASGPHLGGIDVGHGDNAAAEKPGDPPAGVDTVAFGLSTWIAFMYNA